MGLAARCLGHDVWAQHVQPFTDAEKLNASITASGTSFIQTLAFTTPTPVRSASNHELRRDDDIDILTTDDCCGTGFGNETKFDVEVIRKGQLIQNALIVYLGAASEFTGMSLIRRLAAMTSLPCLSFPVN